MKFKDLNDQQKARALDKFRDINVDDAYWNDFIKDQHYSKMNEAGFEGVASEYSGFCSQGDGASFTANSVDIEKFLRKQKRWSHYRPLHELITIKSIYAEVARTDSRYSHYNTTSAVLYGDWQNDLTPKQQSLYDELQEEIDDFVKQAGKDYYTDLETAYYSLISDEEVEATILANDYDFEEEDHNVTYI